MISFYVFCCYVLPSKRTHTHTHIHTYSLYIHYSVVLMKNMKRIYTRTDQIRRRVHARTVLNRPPTDMKKRCNAQKMSENHSVKFQHKFATYLVICIRFCYLFFVEGYRIISFCCSPNVFVFGSNRSFHNIWVIYIYIYKQNIYVFTIVWIMQRDSYMFNVQFYLNTRSCNLCAYC